MKELHLLSALYTWAIRTLPGFKSDAEKEAYVEEMITKSGITEAIVKSLINGAPLDTALQEGIDRSKGISKEIQQSVIDHLHGVSGNRLNDRSY